MISTASAPASAAAAVSSSVSSSLADPVPGTKGTRSLISSAAALIAVARSVVVCADGSPVDPPREMPCDPDSSCQRISARSPSRSGAPSAVNGETTGAMEPRIWAGAFLNLTVGAPLSPPGLVRSLPLLPDRVQPVDGLPLGDHLGDELLLQLLFRGVARDVHGQVARYHDDAVRVAGDDVSRLHRDPGAGDRGVGFPGDVASAENRRMDGGEINRDVEVLQGFAVADRAVGDDALGAPDLRAEPEDVADGSRGRVAARLDDQDLAGPDLLDGPLLGVHPAAAQCPPVLGEQVLAERHVAQRPGESGHLRGRPGGVQPVQGDGVVAAL